MTTEALEQAFADTRAVLANVTPEQLDLPTPCASWKVRDVVNHLVAGSGWFGRSVSTGQSADVDEQEMATLADGDFVSTFDEGAAATVAAFGAPDAQDKMVTLPFGTMPGAAFMGLATTDTFVHGWDVAKATGQSTDIDPALAEQLLAGAQMAISDAIRGPEPAPFGPAQEAPDGASAADRLAAFLGRKV